LFSPLDENGNTDIAAPKVKLHLGFWTDYRVNEPIQQLLLSAVSRAVSAYGHRLTIHSVLNDQDYHQKKPIKSLREEIEEDACDGYIVTNEVSELFEEVVQGRNLPAVYFLSGIAPIEHEPLIFFNTTEAIERAVRKLAQAGYQRIALVGFKHTENPYEQTAYNLAMQREGLSYRKAVFSQQGVGQSIAVMRELFESAECPDALYVSDDNVMVGVAEYLTMQKLVAGVDLGVISLSNRGYPLPPGYNWSRMEFDRDKLAQVIVISLLSLLQTANFKLNNLALHASWIAGETVRKDKM
jgi:DNA-binding LacI/PurR family transcriptional regulator